jgi:hypothetical protein
MTTGRPIPIGSKRVEPDPSITSAIGRHHSLTTAVADLIDNSIDAAATHVLVRFLLRDERAVGLLVIDDGSGMDSVEIDHAMTYARRRDYTAADLGHFGIGLKAASLSQANSLYVWSQRWGVSPVGRGLDRASLDDGPLVQEFATSDVRDRLNSITVDFPRETGTIIEWREVRSFLSSPDLDEQRSWLEGQIESLRTHLGIVLHRILARRSVVIIIDVVDEDDPEFGGVARTVESLDPFAYPASGSPAYPATMVLPLDGDTIQARAHVWPARTDAPTWSLGGRSPLETQGLYIYRRDRLLQIGGWNDLAAPSRDLIYARVSVDLDDTASQHVTINPEKTGVVMDAAFRAAWDRARTPDGRAFRSYLDTARSGAQAARGRSPRPVQIPEPDRGFPPRIVDAFEDNAQFHAGEDPVHVRWRRLLHDGQVFVADRDQRTLWLNSRYRTALGGRPGGRSDDAPVAKALLHLLLGEHLRGSFAGAAERRLEAAWNAILLAAVQEQEARTRRESEYHTNRPPAEENLP